MILHTYDFTKAIDKFIAESETFNFNLKDLPNVDTYFTDKGDIRKSKGFTKFFKALDAKTTNCLYWFEVDSDISCGELIKRLDKARSTLKRNKRAVPVKNKNCDSKVLYLGIRQGGWTKKWKLSNISGRIIQHLGYYKVGTTQGLQLAHWNTGINLKIVLRVIQFEDDFPNAYLEAFEKIMAHKLRPLCGKH